MKIIASRVLAANPGRVWEDLDREGAIVITKDGVPRSIMVATSDATLLEDVQEFGFARARRAVRAIGTRAARTGAAARRPQIEREVAAARRARRRRGAAGDVPVGELDTNVLVSGLLSPSAPPGRLVDALLGRRLRVALDDRVEGEYPRGAGTPEVRHSSRSTGGIPRDSAVPGTRDRPALGLSLPAR